MSNTNSFPITQKNINLSFIFIFFGYNKFLMGKIKINLLVNENKFGYSTHMDQLF
jgi:hypothetical protein